MNHAEVLTRLRASVRAQFRADTGEIDDLVQEALVAALASGASLETLFDEANEQLPALRTRTYWEQRRLRHGALDEAHSGATAPTPTRRNQVRRSRLPKGVLGAVTPRGVNMLKVRVSTEPSTEVRLAAHHLAEVDLARIGYGEPCSAKAVQLISALHAEFYGVRSFRYHWAAVLIELIEEAKMQDLERKEDDLRQHQPAATEPAMTWTRKNPKPSEAATLRVPLDYEQHETTPDRSITRCFGIIDGKRVHVGTATHSWLPEFPYATDPNERASAILNRLRLRLSSTEVQQPLPAFADDPILVNWLFVRAGFGAGGGPDAVKHATLLGWLQDPAELVRQVLSYAQRRAQFGTDAEAELLEAELTGLAERIRARSMPLAAP
jgi:hypothetical protein